MGLIDVELLNLLIKLDEWFEKKRILQVSETMRGDILSLFCDNTVHCDTSLNEDSSISACGSSNSNPADDIKYKNTERSIYTTTITHTERENWDGCSGVCDNINKQVQK